MTILAFFAGLAVGAGISAVIACFGFDDHDNESPQPLALTKPRGPDGRFCRIERGSVGGEKPAPKPKPPLKSEWPSTLPKPMT